MKSMYDVFVVLLLVALAIVIGSFALPAVIQLALFAIKSVVYLVVGVAAVALVYVVGRWLMGA